jgi:hypothetical protein
MYAKYDSSLIHLERVIDGKGYIRRVIIENDLSLALNLEH